MNQEPISNEKLGSIDDLDNKKEQKIKVKIDQKPQQSWCPICSIEYYQKYFSIEQRDIYMRMRCSILSWKPEFLQCVGKNVDLWGPIWIATTIIFILFAGGNLSHYFLSEDKDNFTYQYGFVWVAVLLVYGMTFLVPIGLGAFMKFILKMELGIFEMVCLYGYSMSIYIPMLLLCIIPNEDSQWAFLMIGLSNSTIFLLVNLWDQMKLQKKNFYLVIPMVGINIALLLTFKYYFFGQIYAQNTV